MADWPAAVPPNAGDLHALEGEIAIHALNVADMTSVTAARAAIGGEPIDLLINNADFIGHREGKLGRVDYADWGETLNINLFGPARVAGAFVDNVLASRQKVLATVSTRMSSMSECKAIDFKAYGTSKVALNMMMTLAANELGLGRFKAETWELGTTLCSEIGGSYCAGLACASTPGTSTITSPLETATGSFRKLARGLPG